MSIEGLINKARVGADYAISVVRFLENLRASSDIDDQEEYEEFAIANCVKALEHLTSVLSYLKEED